MPFVYFVHYSVHTNKLDYATPYRPFQLDIEQQFQLCGPDTNGYGSSSPS